MPFAIVSLHVYVWIVFCYCSYLITCEYNCRPHPNECSGSDLDGDIYFVCWDQELIPPRQVEPMDYTPAPTIELDRNVTIEVHMFYYEYS